YRPAQVRRLLASSLAVWQEAADRGKKVSAASLNRAAREVYEEFQLHLDFLKREQLVDKKDYLTADGQWAAELRLDHPLVFYAGIKDEAWPIDSAALAAAVASLVFDKDSTKPLPHRNPPKSLNQALNALALASLPMIGRLEEAGFSTPLFNVRSAWAMWSWATRGDFDQAVEILGLGAGDLAMLTLRVADHLRQMAGLKGENHQPLAQAAKGAIYRILKEPISLPL
ncbi:MAG: hypothetical protein ACRCTY_03985, partial [Candidatus Adiutrix sp.]